MGSTRELKDYLADETFGTNRNPIEPYLSPFIAVTTSHRRSANNFIPRERRAAWTFPSTCQPADDDTNWTLAV